jgi:hypothetical protein
LVRSWPVGEYNSEPTKIRRSFNPTMPVGQPP